MRNTPDWELLRKSKANSGIHPDLSAAGSVPKTARLIGCKRAKSQTNTACESDPGYHAE
ncbi:hypothetical protein [Tellurirhabdus bombi]|uniref:hypothetical protein n=1 Tax=Tellurirhabdus bombi TaxID=2907205 RepID=UPI001F31B647|nr:hypothetical protein [Tellurirhabdus bombi]